MGLNVEGDVWRCNYCGESGGMLALYAKVYGISNSEAYRSICDALQTGDFAPEYRPRGRGSTSKEIPQSEQASAQEIHRTLSAMLSMLALTPAHREHLRIKRGLTDEQIDRFGFKSTPPPLLCGTITKRLMEQGCIVQGVPGFYLNDAGKWTVKFHQRTSGIMIPVCSVDGLLRGIQIRLDKPIRDKDDPPEKAGTKYLPLSSAGKELGVTSGSPVHFVGDPCARVVYVTEGALKADIAHAMTGRTFAATAGANNTSGLDALFAFLRRNGTQEIIEAEDMDKYRNEMVSKGASKVHQLARKNGLECRRLVWNPNYKGINDWQLALRRKKEQKEDQDMKQGQGMQRFRVYQLDLKGIRTYPFAFRGIKALHQAGFQQPPAKDYCLVYDGEISCGDGLKAEEVLERIFVRCNDNLPEGYVGHSLSVSDVVELYDDEHHSYHYCDSEGFAEVEFSSEQAKPMRSRDRDV